ncbi:DUF3987 domain-containing protein [Herbaspirillum frisingense]|uniref:DUF3987 domain-containing protein n=1 Tax=Herbaspirillum frisingense TaxID=92645 RepID=UPI0016001286|nr:DUF3987 domain-containing protein [Herbaspirillum frisingense]QNB06016.1 DUF3987 domain-containing protein [Herbaspirillum frisingense]
MSTSLAPVENLSTTLRGYLKEHSWSDSSDRMIAGYVTDFTSHLVSSCISVEEPKSKAINPCQTGSIIVAPPHSGKTDSARPLHEFYDAEVARHQQKYCEKIDVYFSELSEWKARQSGLSKRIKSIESHPGLSDEERDIQLAELRQRRHRLLGEKPIRPPTSPSRGNDVSLAGIKKSVLTHPSFLLSVDEGAFFFNNLNEGIISICNSSYSGQSHRSLTAHSNGIPVTALLTISVATQRTPFDQFIRSKIGELALGTGFFDRLAVIYVDEADLHQARTYPCTGAGPATEKYFDACRHFFEESVKLGITGCANRQVLKLSARAVHAAASGERYIRKIAGDYAPFFDELAYPGRSFERMIRIAAVSHAFEGVEGDITCEEIENALELVIWHIDNFRMLFDITQKKYLHHEDADRIAELLVMRGSNRPFPISRMKSIELELSMSNLRVRNGITCLLNDGRLKQIEKSGGVHFKLR